MNAEKRKRFNFGNANRRFGRTAKAFLAIMLVCIVLVSIFVFSPKENQTASGGPEPTIPPATVDPTNSAAVNNPTRPPLIIPGPPPPTPSIPNLKMPGIVESASLINGSTWIQIAGAAWKYYQPGNGLDASTWLPWTGKASPYFTDWDLGVYIQAAIDAAKLGLIDTTAFNARMDKVMTWLETRELNNASYPYWFYQAYDGKVWHENSDVPGFVADTADTGRLFVALYNLKTYSSTFAPRVDTLVYHRSPYAALVPSMKAESLVSTSIYSYYAISGFECFWPTNMTGASAQVLSNMFSTKTGTATTAEGVTLPKVSITGDPLLSAYFELSNKDANLGKLVNLTYSAHEAYYNATGGKFRAFGEGPSASTDWQYEWVVLPDGRTWTALNGNSQPTGAAPIIYTKIALSFLAMYNTNYTRSMATYLEENLPSPSDSGYYEGVDENGAAFNALGSLANGLILDASLYYIRNTPY